MNFANLLVETHDRIATVTVNRPKVLNALDEATLKELDRAFASFATDPEVKVVILTGAGEKAFVAGGDIAVMQPLGPVAARDFARMAQKILDRIENSPKPVIAAVNGYALGGGCELAMACDLRIASESARLGQPEINLGIIPGWAGTQRLSRLVGKGRAKELLFTGEMIDAREAWRIGLVNRVVPATELMAATRELAGKIAGKGGLALSLAKEAVNRGLEIDLERANASEADLFGLCFATEDQKEGMLAFLEKRAAVFRDR
jgi:enoyl-CoA hydratase